MAIFSPVGGGNLYTDLSAAVSLSLPDGVDGAYLQAFAQNVRFTLDGSTATAVNLLRLVADDSITLIVFPPGREISVIEETAGASLAVQWVSISR